MIPIRDRNPTDIFPAVTIALIAANVAVFLLQLASLQQFTFSLSVAPATPHAR